MNNLPPGVSANDIPGNSSRDAAYIKDELELEGVVIEVVEDAVRDSRTHFRKEDGDEVMQRIVDMVNWEEVFDEVRPVWSEQMKREWIEKEKERLEVKDETTEE